MTDRPHRPDPKLRPVEEMTDDELSEEALERLFADADADAARFERELRRSLENDVRRLRGEPIPEDTDTE